MITLDVERKSFFRSFLGGIISMGEGFASIASFGTYHPMKSFQYERFFGTDAERLASDWNEIGKDIEKVTGMKQRQR